MARITATNFTGPLQYPIATAATDIFKKEDLQTLAQAVDQHDHTAGKGLSVAPANASITNAKLGPDTARASLLVNGGFEVWQRGAGPFTTSVTAADRWTLAIQGTDTLSVSKNTVNVDVGSLACAACTFVLGTGGGTTVLRQHDFAPPGDVSSPLLGRSASLSVRVRVSTANAVRVGIYNGTAWTYSTFHTGGGAYETLSVANVAIPSNGQVQVGVLFAASCTAYLDNAMLVVGSVPADYAPLHPADDLARCLRYYEVVGDAYPYPTVGGWNANGVNTFTGVPFLAKKAVLPTVTKNGTWSVVNSAQPSVLAGTTTGMTMAVVLTATGYGYAQATAAGQNCTVEANP